MISNGFLEQKGEPASPERTLYVAKVQIERKTFVFSLKENDRGRFLQITERGSNRSQSIIIPVNGMEDFKRILEKMMGSSEPPAEIDPE
jgi:hypothetical protein